jgi:predicted lipid-binding transport protein (Tim44 family)
MVIGFIMRKRASSQNPVMAGAGAMHRQPLEHSAAEGGRPHGGSMIGSQIGGGVGAAAPMDAQAGIPADFDKASFESNAKRQFVALQAANDARDLDRLREYLSPEMLDVVRAEIAERGDAPQRTEVFGLEAQVLSVAEEDGRYVASVRFTGSVRDQHGATPEDLDEIWHLTKPRAGLAGWLIAGIQQHPA